MLKNTSDARSVDVAYWAAFLACNPEHERFLKFALWLQEEVRSGSARLPAVMDFSEYDEELAEAAAALAFFARG